MRYDIFVEELRKRVLQFEDYKEEVVRYIPAGNMPGFEHDMLLIGIADNGKDKSYLHINLEEIYYAFQNDLSLDDIMTVIREKLIAGQEPWMLQTLQSFRNYENMKERIRVRVVPVENMNETDMVYDIIGDIAIILCCYLDENVSEEEITSIRISKYLAETWGKGKEELFEKAFQNMTEYAEPQFISLYQLMFVPGYEGERFMNDPEFILNVENNTVCLTNCQRVNGSAAIFCPKVAKRIAELLESNLYLVFTSCHECMIHKEQDVTPEQLQDILRNTWNETLLCPQDYLSDNIFHYDRETEIFTMVTGKEA